MFNSLTQRKNDILYFCFSFFIILSFIFGFINQENSAGGGNIQELHHHWENLQIFLNNSFTDAINLTKGGSDYQGRTYDSSRTPLLSILQKYIFYFIESEKVFEPEKLLYFKSLSFIISFLCLILLFFILKKKFKYNNLNQLFFLSSVILFLSPYFRTSAFWGFGENYTFLFILSSYLLVIYLEENYLNNKYIILNIFSICFFSSLIVYFDTKALIIPLLCYIKILNLKISIKNKIFGTFFYFLFSIPFLYLIFLWKNIIPPGQSEERAFGNIFLIDNIGYVTSIIAFYLFPFLFFKFQTFFDLFKKMFNKIFLIKVFLIIIYLIIYVQFNNIDNEIFLGKGYLHKLANIFFTENNYKLIFLSFGFFFSFVILFLYLENLMDFFIFGFFLISSVFTTWVYQEYFDPLIYILILSFFFSKIKINNFNLSIIFIYQTIFLLFAINFYN